MPSGCIMAVISCLYRYITTQSIIYAAISISTGVWCYKDPITLNVMLWLIEGYRKW